MISCEHLGKKKANNAKNIGNKETEAVTSASLLFWIIGSMFGSLNIITIKAKYTSQIQNIIKAHELRPFKVKPKKLVLTLYKNAAANVPKDIPRILPPT